MSPPPFKAVLYDLDGTLLDTLRDLADSMNSVLMADGFPAHPVDDYRVFVGDGVEKLVERALPATHRNPELIRELTRKMRKEYARRWLDHSRPYPGILELIQELDDQGMLQAILTNKPQQAARHLVTALLPENIFQLVLGARDSVPKKPDPAGALEAAQRLGVPPSSFLYLGDTNTDMLTARAAGMYAVGVLWGFRGEQELWQSGADKVIARPHQLLELV